MLSKNAVREMIWRRMTEQKVGSLPFPLEGRIPNFKGASRAAQRVSEEKFWEGTQVIKANPDSPQRWLRERALEEGKVVYMAVPRLTKRKCFVEVKVPPTEARKASSIKGAFKYGTPVHPSEMKPIDLIVAGSVAVNHLGERVGKGGGYSDLELAIAHEFELLDEDVPIITTVHDIQVLHERLQQEPHDIIVHHVFTPTTVVRCQSSRKKTILLHQLHDVA